VWWKAGKTDGLTIRLVVARGADTDWVIPASRRHGPRLRRARTTDAFTAGTAVMQLEQRTERASTDAALLDGVVRLPVRGTSSVTQRHYDTHTRHYRQSRSTSGDITATVTLSHTHTHTHDITDSDVGLVGTLEPV